MGGRTTHCLLPRVSSFVPPAPPPGVAMPRFTIGPFEMTREEQTLSFRYSRRWVLFVAACYALIVLVGLAMLVAFGLAAARRWASSSPDGAGLAAGVAAMAAALTAAAIVMA